MGFTTPECIRYPSWIKAQMQKTPSRGMRATQLQKGKNRPRIQPPTKKQLDRANKKLAALLEESDSDEEEVMMATENIQQQMAEQQQR